jgi:Winged helix DNA-binding domain
MPTTISPRALNRATLERQLLLRRAPADLPVATAIERLVGLQAQLPNPPYLGLWSRLDGFTRESLEALVRDRRVVRTGLMRATLHLVTADDLGRLRPVLQSVLDRAQRGTSVAGSPASIPPSWPPPAGSCTRAGRSPRPSCAATSASAGPAGTRRRWRTPSTT